MLAGARELPWGNILGSAIFVMAFFYWARAVFIPLALAVLLTFLLIPVVKWLQRLGLWRVPSVILVVILAGSLLGGIGWVVMLQLKNLANDLRGAHRRGVPSGRAAPRGARLHRRPTARRDGSDPLPLQAAAGPIARVQDRGGALGDQRRP
jgi:hypothetical protein